MNDAFVISTRGFKILLCPVLVRREKMKIMSWLFLVLLSSLSRADDSWPVLLPECGARIERRNSEADLLIARTDCPVSFPSLAQLVDIGLTHAFSVDSPAIRTFYLGRVMNYPEWSQALAEAAAQSPDWNAQRGRPGKRDESDNLRIIRLLNGPAYPQVLKPVVARYGLIACIASVEKVLVFEAKDIFTPASELFKDASPSARLPADAQVWLRLLPMPAECAD
jgi:hypothetical protein